ncbi:MAG: peptidoglycan-binding protein [Desulfuromonadales bacterium]|nr:peptidoglycan-binding protein [Desulfuromonadales bacterium]
MNELQKRTAMAIINIFETGRVNGDYGAVTVLKGDSGHLTYGRSQTTLGSGNLFLLIKAYCDRADACFAAEFRTYLPALHARDFALDKNLELRELLREAGRNDKAMQAEQDRFFEANYFNPAIKAALAKGVSTSLGQTVVYDSFIQGGFRKVIPLIGASIGDDGIDEQEWIRKYVSARKRWLSGLKPPLPGTVYRMDSFARLIDQGAWELPLPLTVHGVVISNETLEGVPLVLRVSAVDPDEQPAKALYLTNPYMRGPEVQAVQEALNTHGFANSRDGIFGPFTETLVKQFQESRGFKTDGLVGPATRSALGL